MNTLHFPAKKKESYDGDRNSLITMMSRKEHSFYSSFYYSLSKKTSILQGSLPESGAF